MEKRGQATLFIILGIIFVVLIIIILFIRTESTKNIGREETATTLSLSNVITKANNLVDLCFSEFADRVIYDAGKHGGYAVIESDNFRGLPYSDGWGSEDHPQYAPLVYLRCGTASLMPDISDVERTIKESIEYSLLNEDCLNDFEELKKEGWEVSGTKTEVIAEINEDGISLELNIPRTLTKDENSFYISNFNHQSNINIPFYLGKAEEIINDVNTLLLNLRQYLDSKIDSGLLSEEEALTEARNQVDLLLENVKQELDNEGYDFYHVTSLDSPVECSQNPELFLIKNRENNFRFVFGASL